VAVLACAVLETEVRHFCRPDSPAFAFEFLDQDLHLQPEHLHEELQKAVERLERQHPSLTSIVLVYGLCSGAVEGIHAERCRLVIPRAHDCITLLLGDRRRYAEHAEHFPGTYWYSPGWNRCHLPPGPERYQKAHAEYCEKYGEDNADYLMELEQGWMREYDRASYVDLGVGVTDQDLDFTRRCADWLHWGFDHQTGDPRLLRDLLSGNWDEERYLVLEPGQTPRQSGDERVMRACCGPRSAAESANGEP
jgi:hypothetical protein